MEQAKEKLKVALDGLDRSVNVESAVKALDKGLEIARTLEPGDATGTDKRAAWEHEIYDADSREGWELPGWVISLIHALAMAVIRKYIG